MLCSCVYPCCPCTVGLHVAGNHLASVLYHHDLHFYFHGDGRQGWQHWGCISLAQYTADQSKTDLGFSVEGNLFLDIPCGNENDWMVYRSTERECRKNNTLVFVTDLLQYGLISWVSSGWPECGWSSEWCLSGWSSNCASVGGLIVFYLANYSNGQILNILGTNVETFKWKNIKNKPFIHLYHPCGHGHNSIKKCFAMLGIFF